MTVAEGIMNIKATDENAKASHEKVNRSYGGFEPLLSANIVRTALAFMSGTQATVHYGKILAGARCDAMVRFQHGQRRPPCRGWVVKCGVRESAGRTRQVARKE
jgi:hypothetical protein